ncbi:MAG: hypothetical protein C4532_16905 [Candidatus Abyssobacteria bacterium SURF_17]|jgi:hypothetical protein|uniref:DUF5619 domain-containing protein n=1 Tax=Candidatus Abyssobacteria bacterium SURF_17 TaxID=2093361 RepID=A0A419ERE4_9BACT|nr:MAG: hypothetical protein C4532_16905 [Candidatus Abyssubacteria bacterium SURF_17]
MKNINLKLGSGVDYAKAEKAAREAAADMAGKFSLLAWYDKAKKTGAPQEACALESWKCVRDYAEHHKADIRVSVNEDAFEFYFAKTPPGTAELKEKHVRDVHKGLAVDRDENVQGG